MRTSEESDGRRIAFDETERKRELLAAQEALRAVDGIERPEDLTSLTRRIEPSGIEELPDLGFGRRRGGREIGVHERLAREPDDLRKHLVAARIERVRTLLAHQAIGVRNAGRSHRRGHRDLHGEVGDGHRTSVVLEEIGEGVALGGRSSGHATGGGHGGEDRIEGQVRHEEAISRERK